MQTNTSIKNRDELFIPIVISVLEELKFIQESLIGVNQLKAGILLDHVLAYFFKDIDVLNYNSFDTIVSHQNQELVSEMSNRCLDMFTSKLSVYVPNYIPEKDKVHYVYFGGPILMLYVQYCPQRYSEVDKSKLVPAIAVYSACARRS